MGRMVYSVLWVMQDLYHQPPPPPHFILGRAGARRRSIAVLRNDVKGLGFRGVIACLSFLAGMFE